MSRRRVLPVAVAVTVVFAAAGCGTSGPSSSPTSRLVTFVPTRTAASVPPSVPAASSSAARSSTSRAPATHAAHPHSSAASTPTSAAQPTHSRTIVIDPGHGVPVQATDPNTGLDVSEYENEPEMRDVYAVAELVKSKLVADGYRVILTKPTLRSPINLAQRARVANDAHAALALSIHDEGGSGGVNFTAGNNIVYYQRVGDYRETPSGKKIVFQNTSVANLSRKYAATFEAKRAAAQGTSIKVQGDTGYDLGSRGLAAGNIWIVQLLSHVPWIYNEAGGNSAGMSGLNQHDKQRYANGLIAAVEACVPISGR